MSVARTLLNNGPQNDLYERILILRRKNVEIKQYRTKECLEVLNAAPLTEAQKKQIDEFYLENYGEKIPYTWHQYYSAFTGNFDIKYFPEYLYISEFERFMNPFPAYVNAFGDKNVLPIFASEYGVKTPKTYFSKSRGYYRDENGRGISGDRVMEKYSNIGSAFIKPSVDSNSGRGCAPLNIIDGRDVISGRPLNEIISGLGNDFVVQERVVCHPSIQSLYSKSVNTFRIVTYRWKDEIRCSRASMRMGFGSSTVDNVHAGGLFIAVDNDGSLHETAYTQYNRQFRSHPEGLTVFEGHKIENFPEVLKAARLMHDAVPQIGIIHWDFTVDIHGDPVLIEANTKSGGIRLVQIPHGKGAFGDDTAEILRWIRLNKNKRKCKRSKLYFGYGV